MSNILQKICEDKSKELEETKKRCSFKTLEKLISSKLEKREFKNELISAQKNKTNFIIGEVKKQSPSAGEIISDYKPEDIAILYERSGVRALSILTESKYFLGNIDHLSLVKKKTNLPILRKDFIIDKYQIYESKLIGADCILLIASILNDNELFTFSEIAEKLGLDFIIEVHDENELSRVEQFSNALIGVNNRNLKTFEVDLNNSIKLKEIFKGNNIFIAESGIKSFKDIEILQQHNINVFLIGESLMKGDFFET